MDSILSLSSKDARKYLLSKEAYSTLDLPEYFNFQPLLDVLNGAIGTYKFDFVCWNHGKAKKEHDPSKEPKHIENLNFKLYHNKDGQYAWRPLTIIHPVAYICLVNIITEKKNWALLTNRMSSIQISYPSIVCKSLPLVEDGNIPPKKDIVLNWWSSIEQESIALSLKFSYIFTTDIVNCYGSIYTHSIVWAIHGKDQAKKDISGGHSSGLGTEIDRAIQAMSYGQTNGIPQGSVLMDLIAEIVLLYADEELGKKLAGQIDSSEYKVLRYRDDYRIFTKKKEQAELIARELSEVLGELNFHLNSDKTFVSGNIVQDSIKKDKRYWLEAKHVERSLQKHLLLIHSLAERYPNSGSLKRALSEYYKRLVRKKIKVEDVDVLLGIIVDIAVKNPAVYPQTMAIIGVLIQKLERDKVVSIIEALKEKFSVVSNSVLLNVWLQRISYKLNPEIIYNDPLTDAVRGQNNNSIWDSDWLGPNYKDIMDKVDIIDRKVLTIIPELVPVEKVSFVSVYEASQ